MALPQRQPGRPGLDTEGMFTVILNELGQIKGRLTNIDGRLDNIDGRLDNIDGRLDNIETDMVYVKAGVDGLIGSVADLSQRVGRLEHD